MPQTQSHSHTQTHTCTEQIFQHVSILRPANALINVDTCNTLSAENIKITSKQRYMYVCVYVYLCVVIRK